MNYNIKETHISSIIAGDTILHTDGFIRTVCKSNISKGFMGMTIFGDPYKLGTILVKKIIFKKV